MKVGEFNELTILRFTSVGAYLGDELENDILLPNKYLTNEMEIDNKISVFVYNDSEDRPVATTEIPLIKVNEFNYLKIKEVTAFGAFADWGLEKDLLIPFKEQREKLSENQYYLVYLRLDEATNRLVGSTKTSKYFSKDTSNLVEEQEVEILICEKSELGVKVVVNNEYQGLIYTSDISKKIYRGERTVGYIFKIREDGKLDIRLEPSGYEKIDELSKHLLDVLKSNNGILHLSDNSDPDEIRETIGMSKKNFKKTIGKLYKDRLIQIKPDFIQLNP